MYKPVGKLIAVLFLPLLILAIPRPQIFEYSVEIKVLDKDGRHIPGLGVQNFSLTSNGIEIEHFRVDEVSDLGGKAVLVIDTSGSMAGFPLLKSKLDFAKEAALDFIEISKGIEIGLVAFHLSPYIKVEPGEPISRVEEAIRSLKAGGGTDISSALKEAVDMVHGGGSIILLTDGQSDINWSLVRMASELGIKVFTIGFGWDVNREDLKRIAEETGGDYYFVAKEGDLIKIYRRIAGSLKGRYIISWRQEGELAEVLIKVNIFGEERVVFQGEVTGKRRS
ncbi:MAG TPA: VWA domain-containing protein [Candidatus Korarchaeota archaeon]|nr:VWA domain-containing protein [Candidatus Korarchaeota archaeon]